MPMAHSATTSTVEPAPTGVTSTGVTLHHVAVQTTDLENCLRWYEDFLGCSRSWSLSEFSELTHRRLPGIRRLVEVRVGGSRLHLFERAGRAAPAPLDSATAFQHVCFAVADPDELAALRRRWLQLHDSGRYAFALPDGPTEIVTDDDGVHSFYAYDVNGLELELCCETGVTS